MPRKRLSDAFVRTVRPPAKDAKASQVVFFNKLDRGLSLALVVGSGGSKTFRCVTYRHGKSQSTLLGKYPELSVADARQRARDLFENPQRVESRRGAGTFEDVANQWLKRHVEARGLRSRHDIERLLRKHVLPVWGKVPFVDIRRRQVIELLDEVADHHGTRMADMNLAVIRSMCNWWQARDEDYVSPIVKGMKRHAAPPRDRVLDDGEIRALWKACDDLGQFGAIVRLLLISGQRRAKVAKMRWQDVNFDTGVWTIPREPREKANAGELRLPEIALSIIREQPTVAGSEFVFAGRGGVAFHHWSDGVESIRAALPDDMPKWVLHDLRRSARSLMSRAGVRPDVGERVLGHAIIGIERTYNRYAFQQEKADALAALARLIESITNPPEADNVFQINTGRGD